MRMSPSHCVTGCTLRVCLKADVRMRATTRCMRKMRDSARNPAILQLRWLSFPKMRKTTPAPPIHSTTTTQLPTGLMRLHAGPQKRLTTFQF
jgi:hypothetical protein